MRAYHKGWQSDRPMKRSTRRVKWYEGQVAGRLSIRLQFEDEQRRLNEFYTDRAKATADYEAFISGALQTVDIVRRRQLQRRDDPREETT